MECPIKNHAFETSAYKGKSATRECNKDICAWWLTSMDCCSIIAIALSGTLIDRGSFAKYAKEE